jgi:mannosyltransferase
MGRREETGAAPRRKLDWALVVVTLIGVAACFIGIGHKPLANDEGTSYFIAQLDFDRLWTSLSTSEANGSPFYLALHVWIGAGSSEAVLRILPALFAAGSVPVVYLLARKIAGRPTATLTAFLMAIDTVFISHAQEIRSYPLALLLISLSTLLFVNNIGGQSTSLWRWLLYAFVSAVAVYAHFYSAFVLGAHGLSFLFSHSNRLVRRKALIAAGLLLVMVSPLAYFIASQDVGQVDWIPPLSWFSLGYNLQDLSATLLPAAAIFLFALAVFGAVKLLRDWEGRPASWEAVLMVGWAAIPLAGSLFISMFKPIFQARYLLVSLPGILFLVACGILSFRWAAVKVVVSLVAVAVLVHSSIDWYLKDAHGPRFDIEAETVAEASLPGDGVIFYSPPLIRPFGYYAGYYDHEAPVEAPPEIYPGRLWIGFSRTRFNPDLDALADEIRARQRVWLVRGFVFDRERRAELEAIESLVESLCPEEAGRFIHGVITVHSGCAGAR